MRKNEFLISLINDSMMILQFYERFLLELDESRQNQDNFCHDELTHEDLVRILCFGDKPNDIQRNLFKYFIKTINKEGYMFKSDAGAYINLLEMRHSVIIESIQIYDQIAV